tara:strand:- start:43 stop:657 length:615 start_codon:yes stop_codon:yes gene_type:complete
MALSRGNINRRIMQKASRTNRKGNRKVGGRIRNFQQGGQVSANLGTNESQLSNNPSNMNITINRNTPTYQNGGSVPNPIAQVNLQARPGQFVFNQTGLPYQGAYHIHRDGTAMIGAGERGAVHPVRPEEVIVRAGTRSPNVTTNAMRQPRTQMQQRAIQSPGNTGGMRVDAGASQQRTQTSIPASPRRGGGYRRGGRVRRRGRR